MIFKKLARFSLEGKTAIITGASSGIGASTALLFSKLGASLSLVGRNVENLDSVAKKCSDNGANLCTIAADVTHEVEIGRIIEETLRKFQKIDILVNNAGIIQLGSIENTSLYQYDEVMNVNVRSYYHLTMLAVPHLIETQGNIVNVSSVNGLRAFPGVLAYNISKSAVNAFSTCVALELAPKNVRVNCVNPGVIITELQKRGGLNDEQYSAFLERSKTTHALGRPGDPEEVAATIAFLASSEASFITGAAIPVDGGRHAMCPR